MAPKTKYSPTLLGADGSPFKSEIITREHFTPTVTGVRSPWSEGIANGLDPSKLAALLKSANEGDNHEFLVLAEEMEERDGHYASVLGQRKRAVSGVLIGSRLWATQEALVHPNMQNAAINATGDDTIRSSVMDIARSRNWPTRYTARVLQNDFTRKWHGNETALSLVKNIWSCPLYVPWHLSASVFHG